LRIGPRGGGQVRNRLLAHRDYLGLVPLSDSIEGRLTEGATAMKDFGTWVRMGITVVLLAMAAAWLFVVYSALGEPTVKGADGSVLDQFQRSKDILLVVMPLLTTALGYWFGSAGRQEAQNTANMAQDAAEMAQRKLASVLDSSVESGLLDKAKEKDPEAFGVAQSPEGDTENPPDAGGSPSTRRYRL
jgi:hypothetical protein